MSSTGSPNSTKTTSGESGEAPDRLGSSVDPARERRFVKGVVAAALFVAAVLIWLGMIKLQCAKLDDERRLRTLRLGLEARIVEAKRKRAVFRFDEAMAELTQAERDLEQGRCVDDGLWSELWGVRSAVAEAHSEHKARLGQGYRVIHGKLLSPSEQERIAEAAEHSRQAEAERRRRERAAAEHRRRAEAERLRREQAEQRELSALAARQSAMRASWVEYMVVCGIKPQEVNRARSKKVFRESYEGETITWEGRVYRVDEQSFGGGFGVKIKMDPTESVGSDVTLFLSTPFESFVIGLNCGDLVEFAAVIQEQGNSLWDHRLVVQAIKKK